MIIAYEVQYPVQDELRQLTKLIMSKLFGLPAGSVERNHDLTLEDPSRRQQITVRKRQHVGRPVPAKVPIIQTPQPVIPGDQDMDL
jgi:hypothetical protein